MCAQTRLSPTRRLTDALARRLGWVASRDHRRLADEIGDACERLHAIERAHAQAIEELQEWNTNQAQEVGELRAWLGAQTDELRRLRPRGTETDRALFLALAQLTELHRQIGHRPCMDRAVLDLATTELRVFSQNGEDGVLAEILRRIGAPDRSFVEFGVETGQEGNCVFLADVAGFSGLFIEANEHDFAELERKYERHPDVITRRQLVQPDTVERIFAEAGVPAEPAVVSIDVDGDDYWIWESLNSYRPRLVIVEYNSMLPVARRLVQPPELGAWDGTDYFGASLGALQQLAASKGYRLVHIELAALNAFFVRDDLAGHHFPDSGDVTTRGLPNYFALGYRHPHDGRERPYLDLDTGQLTSVASPLSPDGR